MAGKDWTDNPFAAAGSDPFQDPSVVSGSKTGAAIPEYNPFGGPSKSSPPIVAPTAAAPAADTGVGSGASAFGRNTAKPTAFAPEPTPAPAPAPAPVDTPAWARDSKSAPAQAAAAAQPPPQPAAAAAAPPAGRGKNNNNNNNVVRAQESADEAQRRREYDERENRALEPKKDPNYRPSNFPPFPAKCPTPFKPCFHHDFKGEIPRNGYKIVKEAYYYWIFTCIAYFWNFIACLAALDYNGTGISATAGVSSAYLILGTPCAYCCWFHQLYTAYRLDSSLRFGWWFFVTCFQFLLSAVLAAGIPYTGGGGFWIATAAVSDYKVVGIILYTSALLWSMNALWCAWLLRRVLAHYRSQGMSYNSARSEAQGLGRQAAYDTLTSDAGQAVVRDAAAAAWANQGRDSHA